MGKKRNFLIQSSYSEAVQSLSDSQAGKVFKALFQYSDTGEMPTTGDALADVVLLMMKNGIDEAAARYEAICEKRRNNANKRWAKGVEQENAFACKSIQEHTSVYKKCNCIDLHYDNDNVNDNDINKERTSSNEEVPKKDKLSLASSQEKSKDSHIDWKAFMDYFNETFAGKLPAIQKLTDVRKQLVKARVAQYRKEAIPEVYKKVLESSFLMGDNDRNWRPDFDWIFKAANFTKILEGVYSNDARPARKSKADNITNVNDEWESRR